MAYLQLLQIRVTRPFFSTLLLLSTLAGSLLASDFDSQVLSEMNLARTRPGAYAEIVAERGPVIGNSSGAITEAVRFLENQKPGRALTTSPGLTQAALSHVLDCGTRGIKGHVGSDGSHVNRRANRFGQWEGRIAENISYGQLSARDTVVLLLIDEGVRDRGHRQNIFQRDFRLVGVASGAHATFGLMVVTDFAATYRERLGPSVAAR
jgi:hypothetical protein